MTIAQLLDAYPYQFRPGPLSLVIVRGWFEVFAELCADIDRELGPDKKDFRWTQLKEKFGAARWYASWQPTTPGVEIRVAVQRPDGSLQPVSPSSQDPIQRLIDTAQKRTATMCMVCGAPAKIELHSRGGYQCLCAKHTKVLATKSQLPKYWFHVGQDDPNDPWGEHA